MENKMRNTLNELYFGKTKDIVNDLRCRPFVLNLHINSWHLGLSVPRSVSSVKDEKNKLAMQRSIADALKGRAAKN